jgi:hypothetical protein
VQTLLEQFAYVSLACENPMLQSRACQIYANFARFEFSNPGHLVSAGESIVNHLHHPHVVVRVDAAIALGELLDHESIVQMIRPNLGNMLRSFLRIMDDMDIE